MNRKLAVSILVLVILGITGLGILNYFLSFKTAYINVRRDGVGVTVYAKNHQKMGALGSSGKLSLRTGDYYLVASGTHINTAQQAFKVGGNGAYVSVDPGYSSEYLDQLLTTQLPVIKKVLLTAYPQAVTGFSVNTGTLYIYGDWYATTLVQAPPGPGATGDVYRVVLHKEHDAWKVVTTPAIVLSSQDYPTIPRAILQSINAQSGY